MDKIIKNENDNIFIKIIIIILNVIGNLSLVYFAIPFITHDMSIPNPNAMLAGYSWDTCGFALTIGLIPLIIANIFAFIFLDIKNKLLKLLYFIPSLICLILVVGYLFISFNQEETYEPEFISSMKCELNGKLYHYTISKEMDETYSVGMDENDKIPLNIIDYDTPEQIFNSIESYYKSKGGMCP